MHFEDKYFSGKVERRDAFRELTACMGIACVIGSQSSICKEADDALRECHKAIIATWHKKLESALIAENVRPVTNLMYAAALVPGGKCRIVCICCFHVTKPLSNILFHTSARQVSTTAS